MGLLVWRDGSPGWLTVLGGVGDSPTAAHDADFHGLLQGTHPLRLVNIQHYALFVYLGLTPWYFFANSVNAAGNSVVVSERLCVESLFSPALRAVCDGRGVGFDFFIAFLLVVGMLIWFSCMMPNWQIIFLPVIVANLILMALGMGTLLAAANVQYRDFRLAVPFLMQVWMCVPPRRSI